ncbi:MAG: hypothetical protein PHX61_02540 [Alphaproteobacteria bacterium]|nr:hypothetical protein [Alphaproteobacteria bacterium]
MSFDDQQITNRIETLKRRYCVVKAKVAAGYKPEYHQAQVDAYKDVLSLFGIEIDKEG